MDVRNASLGHFGAATVIKILREPQVKIQRHACIRYLSACNAGRRLMTDDRRVVGICEL
jgi:hypothetical protein